MGASVTSAAGKSVMQENKIEERAPAADEDAAVRFHDKIAGVWDAKYRSGGFRKRAQFFESQIMPHLNASGHWLDAGCGSGYFSRRLAAQGLTVTGVDASAPMIEAARQHGAAAGFGNALQFETVSTVENLPFADARFDGCICLSVIEYLNNPGACFHELARAVAPGGRLVLSIPHRLAPIRLVQRTAFKALRAAAPRKWEYAVLSRNAVTRTGLVRMLAAYGFRLERAFGFDPVLPAGLLGLLPPSLIFAIAVRQGAMQLHGPAMSGRTSGG
jgi:2-polyprenyl-6-hydroxyphenyl methylase/3-demethylubiquinone-9 3-methyltransferase